MRAVAVSTEAEATLACEEFAHLRGWSIDACWIGPLTELPTSGVQAVVFDSIATVLDSALSKVPNEVGVRTGMRRAVDDLMAVLVELAARGMHIAFADSALVIPPDAALVRRIRETLAEARTEEDRERSELIKAGQRRSAKRPGRPPKALPMRADRRPPTDQGADTADRERGGAP